MLNQQNPFLNLLDSYIEPLIKRVLQAEKLGMCCDVIELDSVLSNCGKGKGDRFKLSIPYAKENLVWNVFLDSQCPEMGPDFIFNDDTFLADIDADTLSTKVPSLAKWDPSDQNSLFNVLTELLTCYKQHQIQLLAKYGKELEYEYKMVVNCMNNGAEDIEVLLLPLGCKPTEVRFLIKLTIDTLPIPGNIHHGQTDTAILIVTFYGPDWKRVTPLLYLSPSLEKAFGGMELPPCPPGTKLMYYVPEVEIFIESKIKWLVQTYEKKVNFISCMLKDYHFAVMEYDTVDCNAISLLLEEKGFFFHVHIHLPPDFPRDRPIVTLQSAYHQTQQSEPYTEIFNDFPYNPSWDCHHMTRKIMTFIKNIGAYKFQNNSLRNIV